MGTFIKLVCGLLSFIFVWICFSLRNYQSFLRILKVAFSGGFVLVLLYFKKIIYSYCLSTGFMLDLENRHHH